MTWDIIGGFLANEERKLLRQMSISAIPADKLSNYDENNASLQALVKESRVLGLSLSKKVDLNPNKSLQKLTFLIPEDM